MTSTLSIRSYLLDLLGVAQKVRKKRSERVATEHDRSPVERWIVFERQTMLDGVNRERVKIGKSPVSMAEIVRVERRAVGHSDFSSKFSLYCAQLVHDPEPQP